MMNRIEKHLSREISLFRKDGLEEVYNLSIVELGFKDGTIETLSIKKFEKEIAGVIYHDCGIKITEQVDGKFLFEEK